MFPMNFVVGAAVGAAATYVFKDESAKQWLSETGTKLKEGTSSFMASFKKNSEEQTENAAEKVEAAAETVTESTTETVETVAEEVADKAEDVKQTA